MLRPNFTRNLLTGIVRNFKNVRLTHSANVLNGRSTPKDSRDKEALFLNPIVQRILSEITGMNEEKLYANKFVSGYINAKFMFLTDEELDMTKKRSEIHMKSLLQIPPFMEPWVDEPQVIEKDPFLQGFVKNRHIFCDISKGFTDRNRLMVVRETDGTLRRAKWSERYRMNQMHFPIDGRTLDEPKMFQDEHLKPILDRFDYRFVLERCVIQFQPDDPKFIKCVSQVYDHVLTHKKFDLLRSTRFFGHMAFYYAFNGNIEPLLADMVQHDLISDAAKLVQLYYIVNPHLKKVPIDFERTEPTEIVKTFIYKEGSTTINPENISKSSPSNISTKTAST